MAPTKQQVLDSLAAISAPDGSPLPTTGTLSEIVVSDGKVFFSITVDAAAVKAWEPIRKKVEDTVRAMPGVSSVMVALTAERTGGGKPTRPAAAPGHGPGHAPGGGPAGVPGVKSIIAVASGK